MGHLTKEEIDLMVKKAKKEIKDNSYCELWSLFQKEHVLHYNTDDIRKTCIELTLKGKYKRIEPMNDDLFILAAEKTRWADFPTKYWLAVALIGSAFVLLTPYLQNKVSKVLSPAATQQNKTPVTQKHNGQKKNDSSLKMHQRILPVADSVK